jgi:hypothetical protein
LLAATTTSIIFLWSLEIWLRRMRDHRNRVWEVPTARLLAFSLPTSPPRAYPVYPVEALSWMSMSACPAARQEHALRTLTAT